MERSVKDKIERLSDAGLGSQSVHVFSRFVANVKTQYPTGHLGRIDARGLCLLAGIHPGLKADRDHLEYCLYLAGVVSSDGVFVCNWDEVKHHSPDEDVA